MLEKLDGSMVGVFFPSGKVSDPSWQTRRAVASIDVARQPRLLARAGDYVRQLAFAKPHTEYTWVFEFVHSVSLVRTKYRPKDYGLYLLGARHLVTHQELNEDQLDDAARQIDARRPRRWGAVACRDEIQRILQEATIDIRGFLETAMRRLALGQGGSAGNPSRLTEILGLDDEIG